MSDDSFARTIKEFCESWINLVSELALKERPRDKQKIASRTEVFPDPLEPRITLSVGEGDNCTRLKQRKFVIAKSVRCMIVYLNNYVGGY